MKCEFQYGELEMVVIMGFRTKMDVDAEGHCTLEAVGEFEGDQLCLGHLTIRKEEAQHLRNFINS
jgi:hypothetical protein